MDNREVNKLLFAKLEEVTANMSLNTFMSDRTAFDTCMLSGIDLNNTYSTILLRFDGTAWIAASPTSSGMEPQDANLST
jgi:hypothetical protein